MAERARRDFDTGYSPVRNVAAKVRSVLVVGQKLLHGKETTLGQHGVDGTAGVAFTENESIPRRPVRPFRVNTEDAAIEYGKQVCARKRRSDMRTTAAIRHPQTLDAYAPCQ
jgi:hypothetical protein